eukprot:TRINITY_DN11429_c0_g1_i1.p1 TRINITY_DN11429_c0_g1~~TRINITY_DN11429_c0_g1_i1.p1  ORF type:complete len:331 (+),score=114.72 TRINITY_DN11429_c0_g1_i1:54-995(+)
MASEFLKDVLEGLRREPKQMSPKYFYDEAGSQLYDQICKLEAYYPTRTERKIFDRHMAEMVASVAAGARVVEPGAGDSEKAELLLAALPEPASYSPVDISSHWIEENCSRLKARFPSLRVAPITGDFLQPGCDLAPPEGPGPALVFFPGSTIGNLHRDEATEFLGRCREAAGPGAMALIGFDLRKDPKRLVRAYDDEEGVTAAFNLNLLTRINRELGANFDVSQFRHEARYLEDVGRIEMHLVSASRQTVTVGGCKVAFSEGESICTEYSYKHHVDEFREMAEAAGWRLDKVWTDDEQLFADVLLVAESPVCP